MVQECLSCPLLIVLPSLTCPEYEATVGFFAVGDMNMK